MDRDGLLRWEWLIFILSILGSSTQEDEDYGRGNRLSGRPPPPRGGQPDLSRDVGEFPYPRGETPVFNFDQGDEVLRLCWMSMLPLLNRDDRVDDVTSMGVKAATQQCCNDTCWKDMLTMPRCDSLKLSLQGFIGTIPPLIHALDAVKDTVQKQRKITQAFGEAFDLCEACGWTSF